MRDVLTLVVIFNKKRQTVFYPQQLCSEDGDGGRSIADFIILNLRHVCKHKSIFFTVSLPAAEQNQNHSSDSKLHVQFVQQTLGGVTHQPGLWQQGCRRRWLSGWSLHRWSPSPCRLFLRRARSCPEEKDEKTLFNDFPNNFK